MQLADDQFQALVDAVSVLESRPARPDDRRAPRLRASAGLQIFPCNDPAARAQVQVRDVSRGGIGVLCGSRASLDDTFIAQLPQATGEPISMLCTVAYWEPLAEHLYAIGMQFQRAVDAAEIDAQQTVASSASPGVLARIGQILTRSTRLAS